MRLQISRRKLYFHVTSGGRGSATRKRRALQANRGARRATHFCQQRAVALHVGVFREPLPHLAENALGMRIRRLNDTIVHPLSFAAGLNYSGPSQVGEVARDLGLISL